MRGLSKPPYGWVLRRAGRGGGAAIPLFTLPSEATVKRVLGKTCGIFSGMTDDPKQCMNRILDALGKAGAIPIDEEVENQVRCA